MTDWSSRQPDTHNTLVVARLVSRDYYLWGLKSHIIFGVGVLKANRVIISTKSSKILSVVLFRQRCSATLPASSLICRGCQFTCGKCDQWSNSTPSLVFALEVGKQSFLFFCAENVLVLHIKVLWGNSVLCEKCKSFTARKPDLNRPGRIGKGPRHQSSVCQNPKTALTRAEIGSLNFPRT